jgi:type II secretory pathway pseudopilin PulG
MTELPPRPPLPTTEPHARKSRRGLWVVIAVAAVVVVGAAIAVPAVLIGQAQAEEARVEAARRAAAQAEAERLDELRAVLDRCGIQIDATTTLLDGGEAVEITRVSKFDGPSVDELYCALERLHAPQSLEAKIGQTRALDGRQEYEWDEFAISWTYHPDDGATVLIERTD